MPELSVFLVGLLALVLMVGTAAGWMLRADRCAREKMAVSASWQDQLESQQSEHNRLAEQNKSLMEQISQYQASQKDFTNRARELSESLKEAFARRDALQRQMKDLRGSLEVAITQRNRLQEQLQRNPPDAAAAIRDKDDKIFKLSRELTSWQSRVPPLVERFQARDNEARELANEVERLQERLRSLEDLIRSDQTRIEPLDANSLPHGGDACNEPVAMGSANDVAEIEDQIEEAAIVLPAMTENADRAADPVEPIAPDEQFQAAAGDEVTGDDADEEPFSAVFMPPVATDRSAPLAGGHAVVADVTPANGAGNAQADLDDLKLIKGIGPSIEKTLNDLGITRFHQIAEMSEYDMDRIAQQMPGFRSRVYRENWIGQARDLQYQKPDHRR